MYIIYIYPEITIKGGADRVIVEINRTLPMGLCGMHDIFEVGVPPHARPVHILSPLDRVGTTFIPCPEEKLAAIVLTDLEAGMHTLEICRSGYQIETVSAPVKLLAQAQKAAGLA